MGERWRGSRGRGALLLLKLIARRVGSLCTSQVLYSLKDAGRVEEDSADGEEVHGEAPLQVQGQRTDEVHGQAPRAVRPRCHLHERGPRRARGRVRV